MGVNPRSRSSLRHAIYIAIIIVFIAIAFFVIYQYQLDNLTVDRETLFQVATYNTFSSGEYAGIMPYSELEKHGDFGIGTFDGLDGEMVALNGNFYQVPYDGKPVQADPDNKTPYATVTFFEADYALVITGPMNYSEIKTRIDALLPSGEAIYAIKISGIYDYAQIRSVPKQTPPYPPISEVIQNQSVFDLSSVSGTAIGFWFPSCLGGVDYVGYHLHFITANHSAGGHLLDCIARNVTVEVDEMNKYSLLLP